MRVRISYGAELEELPKITEDLLTSAIKQLYNCIEALERSLEEMQESNKNYSTSVSIIDNARIKLSNTDLTLSDITAILDGLNNYYTNGEQNVSERRPTMDSSGDAANETTSGREG